MGIQAGGGPTPRDSGTTYQNVELRRGRHSSPEEGACVVELASMLAGERFSDHPASVCPVIAAYMRTLNDGLSDSARQELYGFAAEIVDTRGSWRLRRARTRACARWVRQLGTVSGPHTAWMGLWGSPRAVGALCAKACLEPGNPPSLGLSLARALIDVGGPEGREVQLAPPLRGHPRGGRLTPVR